jgi:hypothetical protein
MLGVAAACSSSSGEPTLAASKSASVDAFAGSWRSVTPSTEFIRLSIVSKSSQQGELGARMTFSGVAWEGSGRIEGDSLRLDMTMAGSSTAVASMVIRASDAQTIRLQTKPAMVSSQSALALTLVRE